MTMEKPPLPHWLRSVKTHKEREVKMVNLLGILLIQTVNGLVFSGQSGTQWDFSNEIHGKTSC